MTATGTDRRVGGHWWDVASADGREPAGGQAAAELAAGKGHRRPVSERASSKLRSSTCSPVTSPSRQQPIHRLVDLVGVDADRSPGVKWARHAAPP